jgi:hypothetical protein
MDTSSVDTRVGTSSSETLVDKVEDERLVPSTDFGFLPVPKRLRYDPNKPFHFGLLLNASFGFASTFSKSLIRFEVPSC